MYVYGIYALINEFYYLHESYVYRRLIISGICTNQTNKNRRFTLFSSHNKSSFVRRHFFTIYVLLMLNLAFKYFISRHFSLVTFSVNLIQSFFLLFFPQKKKSIINHFNCIEKTLN